MKITSLLRTLVVVVALHAGLHAADRPKIVVLATGGTIAGAQSSQAEAGYKAGSFSVDDLITAVPQLKELADISGEQVANIGSQNMNHAVWLKLAARVNAVLAGDATGVVVTHGTDTIEETGYFLSLVVKSDKPVVLVGSMRPATAISPDGPMNLYNAVALAAYPDARGRGPLVVLNDEIHYAREVAKTDATQLDTFKSPNRGRAGLVNTGRIHLFSPPATRHTLESEFSIDGLVVEKLPRVEIVYAYANVGRDTIDHLVARGVKGIILAGVGDGNATDDAIAGLRDAVRRGVTVVRATRVGGGIVDRNIELNDDELGFIAAMELNPQKARILLLLGLTRTADRAQLQDYFRRY